MIARAQALVVLSAFLAWHGAAARGAQAQDAVAKDPLKFKAEPLGRVLPYQALRVRVTLTNESKARIEPLVPLTFGVSWTEIHEPFGTKLRPFRQYDSPGTGLSETGLSGSPSPLGKHDERLIQGAGGTRRPSFGIDAGKSLSLSFAEGNEYGLSDDDEFCPVFADPGRYVIRIRYDASYIASREDAPKKLVYETDLEIAVERPAGVDAKIADMLAKNDDLADAMCAPHYGPDQKATIDGLQEILKLAPESSYALYARFALARARLGTGGIGGIGGFQIYNARELLAERRIAALEELKRIDPKGFAYGPQVLVLRRLLETDAAEQDRLGKVIQESCPDALERFEDDAYRADGYPKNVVPAPSPFEVKVAQLDRALPFQAVRTRITLANTAKLRSAAPLPMSRAVQWVSLTAPGGAPRRFRSFFHPGTGLDDGADESPLYKHYNLVVYSPTGLGGSGVPIEPNQVISLTFAEGIERDRSYTELTPAFPTPGRYVLRARYGGARPGMFPDLNLEAQAHVDVEKPQGVDERIVALLAKNQDLANAMASARYTPSTKETLDALKQVLKLAPDSSYASYARFALARCRLGMKGIGGIDGFQIFNAHELPEDRRKETLAELKQIKTDKFAYGPQVLVLQRLLETDPAEQERLGKLLKERYPDSIERAEDDANRAAGYPKKREPSE